MALLVGNAYDEFPGEYGKILITEVFASPSSSVSNVDSGSLLGREWLELLNTDASPVSLHGWTLTIGKKTITFGPSSIIDGGNHVIILAHQLGLKLRNEGDTIELKSPSKTVIVSLSYPTIKRSQSYVFDERTESWCMSKSPSPGESGSCATAGIAAADSRAKSTALMPKSRATAKRKSVYDKYAQHYKQSLQNFEQPDIVIGSSESGSSSSGLMLTLGIFLGGLLSFGLLKIPMFRRWLEVGA
jgi:hypothetical protein